MPRPIATSQAAITITTIAKIWPSPLPHVAREADQREVAGVEHQLEAQQHDERVAPDQHADGADAEDQRRDDEEPVDVHAPPSGSDALAAGSASSSPSASGPGIGTVTP